jgi:hypothetical protein
MWMDNLLLQDDYVEVFTFASGQVNAVACCDGVDSYASGDWSTFVAAGSSDGYVLVCDLVEMSNNQGTSKTYLTLHDCGPAAVSHVRLEKDASNERWLCAIGQDASEVKQQEPCVTLFQVRRSVDGFDVGTVGTVESSADLDAAQFGMSKTLSMSLSHNETQYVVITTFSASPGDPTANAEICMNTVMGDQLVETFRQNLTAIGASNLLVGRCIWCDGGRTCT